MKIKPIVDVTVYWDEQESPAVWGCRYYDEAGSESYEVLYEADDNRTLEEAVEEAIRCLRLSVQPTDFTSQPNVDGGVAYWQDPDFSEREE